MSSQAQLKAILTKGKTEGFISNIRIENEGHRVTIKGDFSMDEDIIFHAGENYDKEIFFDGGNFRNIVFCGGTFNKLVFRRGNYNGFVSIRGGNIGSLILLGGSFNHWLGTLDGTKNEENGRALAEEPLIINRFEIEGGTYSNNMWISGGKIGSLEIKCVTGVKIHCKPNDDNFFDSIENKYTDKYDSSPDIGNLIISRYSNKDSFYHFSDLKLDTIKFENFTNLGNITLAKVGLSRHLCIENSDLGKTSFIDCDFSKQTLFFDSSKITDIALAGVTLPEPERIESRSLKSEIQKVQKKLALSQIKKVYQNMGDMLMSGTYQAEELNTYMDTLPCSWEKANLWLNRNSNNHGQSWGRAFWVLIGISTFFYTLYCFTLGFTIDFSCEGLYRLFNNAEYYLEYVNPIRKSEFLPKVLAGINEVNIPAGAIVVDSIGKLCNAYLIYQFIAAFRKHGKKD